MEERAREILFRTRRHATGTYAAYPPALQQVDSLFHNRSSGNLLCTRIDSVYSPLYSLFIFRDL